MNNDRKIAISSDLDSALDNLNEIHKQMRWLELAHLLSPSDQDLTEYRMLIDDLTATLTSTISDLTSPTEPDLGNPAALAASAFPLAISTTMNTTPGPELSRTRGAPPGGPHTQPEP